MPQYVKQCSLGVVNIYILIHVEIYIQSELNYRRVNENVNENEDEDGRNLLTCEPSTGWTSPGNIGQEEVQG